MTAAHVYYNENDKFCVSWLRELMKADAIAEGDIDDRSIKDVRASDLRGYTRCHFFAGIGIWEYALQQAGWPDDREVWTGSCPCQCFSAAGQRKGFDDERHLWPFWFPLIRERRPVTVFGEQVASKDALAWLDLVSTDLEGAGYAVGAIDTCAASVGAPHIRQRLYFVADAQLRATKRQRFDLAATARKIESEAQEWKRLRIDIGDGSTTIGLDQFPERRRRPRRTGEAISGADPCGATERSGDDSSLEHSSQQQMGISRRAWESGATDELGDTDDARPAVGPSSLDDLTLGLSDSAGPQSRDSSTTPNGYRNPALPTSFWSKCAWVPCIDGNFRPVEPGTFPLAHGYPNRVGTLRGYGNALVAPLAVEFIKAVMETL